MSTLELLHSGPEHWGVARYYRVPWRAHTRESLCAALGVSRCSIHRPEDGGFIRVYVDPRKVTVHRCTWEHMPLPARIASQRL